MRTCTRTIVAGLLALGTLRLVSRDRSKRKKEQGRTLETSKERVPWGTLSRDQVVEAAMNVVRRGDSERMTIRSLAGELGVAPMSLYRHVRSKDDLLGEVLDRLLAPAWRPRVDEGLWQAWVADAANRLRGLLVSEPVALQVYLRHPVVSPAAIERMDAMIAVLRAAGLDEQAAESAYAAVQNYTLGFAALEASRERWRSPRSARDPLTERLAGYTTPRQFAVGLQFLLDAVGRRALAIAPGEGLSSISGSR